MLGLPYECICIYLDIITDVESYEPKPYLRYDHQLNTVPSKMSADKCAEIRNIIMHLYDCIPYNT